MSLNPNQRALYKQLPSTGLKEQIAIVAGSFNCGERTATQQTEMTR